MFKTASSARAAELLDSSGQVVPFIGFDGCSTLPLSFSEKVADVSCNDILPEVRNAFKKLAKKDALTREKGLKEMAALLETLEMKQIERCFPLYASAFPKLALDGILVIRTACIRLLESFIKALRKSSERYMKTVLPYVIFAMHDGYSQVVQYAHLLFTNCFNEENRRKAIAICLQVTCDIALQILERTHPLLSKGEGEETDNQRECRLSAQSLACLASLCERLDSAGERERIVKLIQNRHLYKQLISCSPQVMSGMFSLGSRLLILDWAEGVPQSGLPASALSNLDNPDRTVCRLAADYLVACAKGIHLFKLLNVNKAVIPKLVSIIRRKESHWMNLESKLMVIVKLTFDNVSSMDKEPFLGRVLDAFFDGMPADSSFSVSNWANALVELAEMAFSDLDSADENMKREDFVEHFFSKVFVAIELTMKRGERGAMRAVAALPLCILRSETTVPQHMVEHFRRDLFMNLFNRLPASEPVVEQLFISPYCGTLLDLAVMILRSATSSAAIVAHIIESCDEAFLIQINRCTSLAEAVAAKVDWNANETRIIRALLRAVSVTQGSLSEFIKLDDEMCCARLVETVSSSGAWALLPRVLSSQIWQSVVEKAATFSIRSCEREKWRMVLECVVTLPNSTAVISSILENNELKNAELFIDLMIACAKNTVFWLRFAIFITTLSPKKSRSFLNGQVFFHQLYRPFFMLKL
ncbi:E3 ubiquitin-protein ligase listerin [Toxocara canis]|uniref:E3 ubiquitin-protein ligase listerin n=1 Tax=Toxocara canis TaxID=6265 RepID=A0A0B2VZF7_TOXCA|nr:E3 ubiquitin-protein ligase listerin [Toxocara canis]